MSSTSTTSEILSTADMTKAVPLSEGSSTSDMTEVIPLSTITNEPAQSPNGCQPLVHPQPNELPSGPPAVVQPVSQLHIINGNINTNTNQNQSIDLEANSPHPRQPLQRHLLRLNLQSLTPSFPAALKARPLLCLTLLIVLPFLAIFLAIWQGTMASLSYANHGA